MEDTTNHTAPGHYVPSPEKLAGLGFEQDRDRFGLINDLWILGDSKNLKYLRVIGPGQIEAWEANGTGGETHTKRLRTEADFDLLLWQIGWTDVEPVASAGQHHAPPETEHDAMMASGADPLDQIQALLDFNERRMLAYISEAFSKEEAARHSDNILNLLPRGVVSMVRMDLVSAAPALAPLHLAYITAQQIKAAQQAEYERVLAEILAAVPLDQPDNTSPPSHIAPDIVLERFYGGVRGQNDVRAIIRRFDGSGYAYVWVGRRGEAGCRATLGHLLLLQKRLIEPAPEPTRHSHEQQ